MELDYKVYRIHLNHTFGLSRSKNDWYDIIILYLIDGEFIGRGEAAPSARYNESSDRILSALKNKLSIEKSVLLASPTACEVISASIYSISH